MTQVTDDPRRPTPIAPPAPQESKRKTAILSLLVVSSIDQDPDDEGRKLMDPPSAALGNAIEMPQRFRAIERRS
jgi:hypothetical protein